MRILKREILIYFVILFVLAGIWHNVSLPTNVTLIFSSNRPFHPLEWGMVGYLILWIPRGIVIGIKKLLNRGKNSDTSGD